MNGVLAPAAAILFWSGLRAYGRAFAETRTWQPRAGRHDVYAHDGA